MTQLRTPKFWLLTTAAFIVGSATAANAKDAQTYHTGAPTMVAAAPGLPSIPAQQIARDVTTEFNPRTGTRELIAAPFDPFEEDPSLAGSLRLRSADGAVAIDGRSLRDGALVEVDFYYNSPSDDPYGGRNYSEMSFVNGETAPVILRDTRVLECSTRVENVVYNHKSYYDRGLYRGIYCPHRHYAGHFGFGVGFGSSYYGPGFGLSGRRRSFGSRGFGQYRGPRTRRITSNQGLMDLLRERVGGESNEAESNGADRDRAAPTGARRLTNRDIDERLSRIQSYRTGQSFGQVIRNQSETAPAPARVGNPSALSRISTGAPATSQAGQSELRSTRERPETRRSEPRRIEQRLSSRSKKTTSPKRSLSRAISKDRISARIKRNFFPKAGFGGRSLVSTRSVDCAREDKLRVFIPNERLDAARFDGLTLIAMDARGEETPIYLPPNYIEGYRMAANGQVRPQGVAALPQYGSSQTVTPQYTAPVPNATIEAAPCPSGTRKHVDGTCLQIGTTSYP